MGAGQAGGTVLRATTSAGVFELPCCLTASSPVARSPRRLTDGIGDNSRRRLSGPQMTYPVALGIVVGTLSETSRLSGEWMRGRSFGVSSEGDEMRAVTCKLGLPRAEEYHTDPRIRCAPVGHSSRSLHHLLAGPSASPFTSTDGREPRVLLEPRSAGSAGPADLPGGSGAAHPRVCLARAHPLRDVPRRRPPTAHPRGAGDTLRGLILRLLPSGEDAGPGHPLLRDRHVGGRRADRILRPRGARRPPAAPRPAIR